MNMRLGLCFIATILLIHQATHATVAEASTDELVAIIGDPNRPAAARIEAERLLIGRVEEHHLLREHRTMLGRKDPEALPLIFREFNRDRD